MPITLDPSTPAYPLPDVTPDTSTIPRTFSNDDKRIKIKTIIFRSLLYSWLKFYEQIIKLILSSHFRNEDTDTLANNSRVSNKESLIWPWRQDFCLHTRISPLYPLPGTIFPLHVWSRSCVTFSIESFLIPQPELSFLPLNQIIKTNHFHLLVST